tara:strand:- start:66 stop:683 length:618 start_codon:yes stop_codon:yes gene_type:complete
MGKSPFFSIKLDVFMIFKITFNFMIKFNFFKIPLLLFGTLILLSSCEALKYKKVSAKDYPPEPEKRVKKNIEEGRAFRLMGRDKKGGVFDFASSNPLWRASLDTINFLPLISANYSGGIIISDWYSANSENESIKITIRFLTNEIRADALEVKVFTKQCGIQSNCVITESDGQIIKELKKNILKKAAIYEKELKANNKKYLGKIR